MTDAAHRSPKSPEAVSEDHLARFARLVDSVGVKRFSSSMDLSTRQVNRMLGAAQPNPVDRLIRSLQAADAEAGDAVLDYICQELGGHFVRQEGVDDAAVNAVKECAEAIAAISDGEITSLDVREIREAISALSSLIMALRRAQDAGER
ncbi:MAG: hypothetical protein AB8G96_07580 [Phycisphaerales bacterium]